VDTENKYLFIHSDGITKFSAHLNYVKTTFMHYSLLMNSVEQVILKKKQMNNYECKLNIGATKPESKGS